MSPTITTNKIPRLRFPEFSDNWELTRLGSVGRTVNGLTYSPKDIADNGLLVLRSSNIKDGGLKLDDTVYVNQSINNEYLTKNGDILICIRNGSTRLIGKYLLINQDLSNTTHGAFMTVFRSKSNAFINQLFATRRYKKQIQADLGARINSINTGRLVKYSFPIPGTAEQRKIAEFLGTVDEKIALLTKKKEQLEKYKKGVMQKIFSQEICFKDKNGQNFPDWQDVKAGSILKERKTFDSKGNQLEHISLTTQGVVPKSKRYERDFLVSSGTDKQYKITRLNDICYNPANLKFGVIARNKFGDGIFSPIYVTFEVVSANTTFVEYFVTRNDFIQRARKFEEGTVYERMAVKPSDFVKLSIKIPGLSEQNKIAEFLSNIDMTLDNEERKLEKAKEFKKALLQQMFV